MADVMQSAVRLPTPEPANDDEAILERATRKHSMSRSPSPRRDAPSLRRRSSPRSPHPAPSNEPLPRDVDRSRAVERARQLEMRQRESDAGPSSTAKLLTDADKQAAAKAEYEKLLTARSGGTYIPPARLRALQAQITDKTSKEYQRIAWEALKKSINGLINKVSISNIKHIVPELFNENLVRGRGLFCRSIMKAQAASLPFTPIYAAMAAIVNTKLPQVGELLVNRLLVQFRKAFKRNDKSVCLSATTFLAHLINQQVAHEMLAAQIMLLLLHKPTDDGVEIAVGLMKEVGQHVEEMNSQIALAVYDQFRSILHEADIDKRVQYMIEVLFQVHKEKYKDNPAIKEELDLVEEEDQITHRPGLDDQLSTEDGLNVFKFDEDFEANEEAYRKLKAEILGEGSGSEAEDNEDTSDASSEDEEEAAHDKAIEIKDQSNTDLVNLRRSIYLTIMSSGGFEEACHKLMRINLPAGREDELPSMIIECCSQERTYNKFFGLIGERFCKLNRLWQDLFQQHFAKYYDTIHRFETNRLRIIAQFFGHLLASDAVDWNVLNVIKLNEEDTTSSSRIFIKILVEDLAQGVGMKTLTERLTKDDQLKPALTGMFPTENPKDTRFSINFFTAIGMGALTEGMREWLKNLLKPAPPAVARLSPRERSASLSSYSSYSSYSSRSDSRSVTPPQQKRDDGARSYTRSPQRHGGARREEESYSHSPPRRRGRSLSDDSRSPSPPRTRGRARSRSYDSASRSRTPPRRGDRRRSYRDDSLPPPSKQVGVRRRSVSNSQSSPAASVEGKKKGRGRELARSASPPPAREKAAIVTKARDRSDNSHTSRSQTPPPRRRAAGTAEKTRAAPLTKPKIADKKRRRNTSSPETSRSPPPKSVEAPVKVKPVVEEKPVEDLSGIHPSRRGLVSGAGGTRTGRGGGRARASDFI